MIASACIIPRLGMCEAALTRASQDLVLIVLLALGISALPYLQQGSSSHTARSKATLRDGLTYGKGRRGTSSSSDMSGDQTGGGLLARL